MEWIVIIVITIIGYKIYNKRQKTTEIDLPENIVIYNENYAFNLINSIKEDSDKKSKLFQPLPDVLMKIDRLKNWYIRISEIDKHNKQEVVHDAIDFKDAIMYVHGLHYYYLKCNADVDESDWEELDRTMPKLNEIEKRWAKKLNKNLEKYLEWEQKVKNEFTHIQ